jgi:formate/nitrite transporter FocA (FNT family)
MKLETLMLQIVFTACLLLCVLAMGALLTSHATVAAAVTIANTPMVAMVH